MPPSLSQSSFILSPISSSYDSLSFLGRLRMPQAFRNRLIPFLRLRKVYYQTRWIWSKSSILFIEKDSPAIGNQFLSRRSPTLYHSILSRKHETSKAYPGHV